MMLCIRSRNTALHRIAELQPTVHLLVCALLQAKTSLALKATAGLRLLPGSKAQDILEAVTEELKKTGFLVKGDAVGIMDGAHEGAFAWLTLNYLLGKLSSGNPTGTVAAIDLGGGSVQEAFALPEAEAAAAPTGYITQLKSSGTTYSVYVHR
jgi:apyrase